MSGVRLVWLFARSLTDCLVLRVFHGLSRMFGCIVCLPNNAFVWGLVCLVCRCPLPIVRAVGALRVGRIFFLFAVPTVCPCIKVLGGVSSRRLVVVYKVLLWLLACISFFGWLPWFSPGFSVPLLESFALHW